MTATFMPTDPDRWADHEALAENPKAALGRLLREVHDKTVTMATLLMDNEDLVTTVGGVTSACLSIVTMAADDAIRGDDPGHLAELFEAMNDVEALRGCGPDAEDEG